MLCYFRQLKRVNRQQGRLSSPLLILPNFISLTGPVAKMPKTSEEGSIYPHILMFCHFLGITQVPWKGNISIMSSCQVQKYPGFALPWLLWTLNVIYLANHSFQILSKITFHSWFLLNDQIDWRNYFFSNIRAGSTCNITL